MTSNGGPIIESNTTAAMESSKIRHSVFTRNLMNDETFSASRFANGVRTGA